MSPNRALDWLLQAQDDLAFAMEGLKLSHYSQVCFLSQQAAEKAIKSICYYKDLNVRGHSIKNIAKELGYNGEIEEAATTLDLYYISARYPDALPEGAPFQQFSKAQAETAIKFAERIIKKALDILTKKQA